ncbi:MAG: hypothetical protein Q4D42_10050, partial [Eubacteriales bacterium]|nr:hypothetical protein [Eubacteriales bacterium]
HHPEKNQVSDIAEYFSVKHTSVLHVLRLLEKKGCIYREETENGRRPVKLTQHGAELVKMNESSAAKMEKIMFAGLSEEERRTFIRLIQQINENCENGGIIDAKR